MTQLENAAMKYEVPPHILVMEDEPSVAQGLQMVLTDEGYDVDVAMTGGSALNTFGKKGFDLLVADLRLPDIDGMVAAAAAVDFTVYEGSYELRPGRNLVAIELTDDASQAPHVLVGQTMTVPVFSP